MAYEDVVKLLDETEVVAIVTTRENESAIATPIWSIVIDDTPYIRSAYGAGSWWYRHVMARRPVAFALGDGAVAEREREAALELPREPVVTERVPEDDPIQVRVDQEIRRKYATAAQSSVDAMLSPEARACTLRVGPPVSA